MQQNQAHDAIMKHENIFEMPFPRKNNEEHVKDLYYSLQATLCVIL